MENKYDEEIALNYLAHRDYKVTQVRSEIYTSHDEFKQMYKLHRKMKKVMKFEKEEIKNDSNL